MTQLPTLHSHILGGLYGQALGDAWGMPALLRPDQTWVRYNGWIEDLIEPVPEHPVHAGLQAGEVTDDTQQAFALAQAIIKDGQITVDGAARAIVAWYDQIDGDKSPYVGPSTRRAVAALKAGQDPHETGLRGDTNGGAMRISPIGLIHPGNPDAAIEDAIIASTPTHFTDVAVSGACAVAAAVAEALAPRATLETIIQAAIHGSDIGLRRGHPWLGASVPRKIDYAVRLATEAGVPEMERLQNLYDLIGSTLATADSVPCAFGILAMADGDPVYAAIYAAALSGDADTVGAIACAIAGAWHGIDTIPPHHVDTLRQANPQLEFEPVAEGLYQIALLNYEEMPEPPGVDFISDIFEQDEP
ncbi:MAG: ADP-ribosylglycohydrolase family protein [Anaerolineae bacterium]|nr:ADP-ribosylglycohydrolase family protein [Anaerolineae bacterium]